MRKIHIWILIAVVSVTLLFLIIVQGIWIKRSININTLLFSQQVNSALSSVVIRLQQEETVYHIYSEANVLKDTIQKKDNPLIDQSNNSIIKSKEIYLKPTAKSKNLKAHISVIPDENIENHNKNVKKNETVENIDNEYEKNIIDKARMVERIINRMLSTHLSIEERVSQKTLEKTINAELILKGISIPYQYAVKDEKGEIHIKSENYSDSVQNKKYFVRLFPDDIFNSPYFLYIYFPNEFSYIYRSSSILIFISLLLTLTIIIIIFSTIYIILRQKRLSEIKTDFINNMTHELKTPISTISLASQMLYDPNIPIENKNIKSIASIIMDESRRLSQQVEKVLQMAVFEKSKIKLKIKNVNIHEVIDQVINNMDIQIKNKKGRIFKELNASLHIIKADEMHITNILINLIDNAIKYCDKELHIIISTENTKNGIIISIKDNGIGISKENQAKIFEQFYRVPTGNIHTVKGFGLGLNYVKKIVDEHRGKITLDSKLGEGSNFKIFLPFDFES